MNNQHIQPPMFTSANASGAADFDFHEVFAEYFVNEFDDPLNAYTGGMANYGVHLPSIPMTVDGSSDPNGNRNAAGGGTLALPTGGIRTAFHAATTPAPSAASPDPGGPAKRIKTDDMTSHLHNLQLPNSDPMQMHNDGTQMQQQFQPEGVASNSHASMGAAQNNNVQNGMQVTLPIGVGIRFGNVAASGGITTPFIAAQQQQQEQPKMPMQFNHPGSDMSGNLMWNLFNQHSNGGNSDQAVAERRERNREHAKRSRVRKKFILESLQEQVRQLQRDNASLRLLVQEHIPENAMQIFDECCSKNPLFSGADDEELSGLFGQQTDAAGDNGKELVRSDFSLMSSLSAGQKCFVLSDPKLPDNPIVYATPAFYEMTGYSAKEVLGRNCRFLQGPGTDRKTVDVLRKSVQSGADATVCLLNYKADGTPFWNQRFVAALRDSDNCIVNYVGVQTEVEPESAVPSYLEDKVNSVLPLHSKDAMED